MNPVSSPASPTGARPDMSSDTRSDAHQEEEQVYLLRLQAAREEARHLATMLEEAAVPEASAVSYFEGDTPAIWDVTAYYQGRPPHTDEIEELARLFGCMLPDLRITPLEPENWVRKVQQALKPVSAGRFVIYGSHDADRMTHHPLGICIDAGEAFGTAHHGTTRGCLELLDQLCKKRRFHHVLDLGTGTGILAIACARLQRHFTLEHPVLASDIDPVACRIACENACLNGVGAHVRTQAGAGFLRFAKDSRHHRPYDLVLANILAGPLSGMAQDFTKHTRKNSYIILSGILDEQARFVLAHFRQAGFVYEAQRQIEGWTSLLMRRC